MAYIAESKKHPFTYEDAVKQQKRNSKDPISETPEMDKQEGAALAIKKLVGKARKWKALENWETMQERQEENLPENNTQPLPEKS